MQILLRIITFAGLLCAVVVHSRGKILRFGYKFFGRFTLIDGNSRLISDNAISVAEKTTLSKCTYECMKEKICKSINHNEDEEKCELLEITKFDHPDKLNRDLKWKHYETNDDENNIGELCEKLSPCKDHEVCEDTNRQPPYICRCRDGFEGDKCDVYKGPGYDVNTPAPSCRALFGKFKQIQDGRYWIKDKQLNCTRRVDGGYSPWSTYGPCNVSCGEEGVQVRKRRCTQPVPKGGGKSCERLGEDAQRQKCLSGYCNCSTALQDGKSTSNLKIGNLKEEVRCGIFDNHKVTFFSHDAEKTIHFESKNKEKSRNIVYVNSIEFINKAMKSFQNCQQRFYVESYEQYPFNSYFENTEKKKLFVNDDNCINCKDLFGNVLGVKKGFGYIKNKEYLPVTAMTFKDTDHTREFVKIKLDKLMCW